MSMSKISVIIITYNGKLLLEKCLESLFKVNYDNFEVILVDNNSTDETIDFITKNYPSVILIKLNSNKGFAEPNNIGAKIAKGEHLLFLNNDTIVTPNFISELVKVMENNAKVAICQSLLLKLDGSIDSSGDFIDKLGVVYNSKTKTDEIREISSARGASMLVRRSIFKKLDGFDEKFFVSFEDIDLGWRTWILGYRVFLAPKSIVYHLGGTTTKKIKLDIAFHGFKNQLSMKFTNFEKKQAIYRILKFFVIYGFREIRIWFDYKLKSKTKISSTPYENNIAPSPSFRVILQSFVWILKNRKYLAKKYKKINSYRKISTLELEKNNILSDVQM
jgi:GT2 family glycosyltransferase